MSCLAQPCCPQLATALPAPEISGAHGAAGRASGISIDIIRAQL